MAENNTEGSTNNENQNNNNGATGNNGGVTNENANGQTQTTEQQSQKEEEDKNYLIEFIKWLFGIKDENKSQSQQQEQGNNITFTVPDVIEAVKTFQPQIDAMLKFVGQEGITVNGLAAVYKEFRNSEEGKKAIEEAISKNTPWYVPTGVVKSQAEKFLQQLDGYVDTFAGQAKESEKLAAYKAMSKIGKNGLIQGLLKQQWGFSFEDRVKRAGEQALDSLEKFSANRLSQIEKEMDAKKKEEEQKKKEEEQKKKIESVEQKDNKDISKNNEDISNISVEEKGKNSQEITNDNSIKENKKENDNQQINNTNSKQEQIEKNTDTVANKIETKQPIQQENSIPAKQDIVEANNIENIDSAKNNIDTELLNKDNKDQIEHNLNNTTMDTSNVSNNNDDTISEIDDKNNEEQNKEATVNSTTVVANLSSAIKTPNNTVQKGDKGNDIVNSLNKDKVGQDITSTPTTQTIGTKKSIGTNVTELS